MITTSLWTVSIGASIGEFPDDAGVLALPELEDLPGAAVAEELGEFELLEDATSAVGWFGSTIFSKSSFDEQPEIKHTTPTHPKNVVIFFMFANIVYILALH